MIKLTRLFVFGCVAGLITLSAFSFGSAMVEPLPTPDYSARVAQIEGNLRVATMVINAFGPDAASGGDSTLVVAQAIAVLDQSTAHLWLIVPPPEYRAHYNALTQRLAGCRALLDQINAAHRISSTQLQPLVVACYVPKAELDLPSG